MRRTQIQLDERTYETLRRRAFEKGCSISSLVREVLAYSLGTGKPKQRTSIKDFSFIGGFLMVGILVAFLAGLGAIFFDMPGLSLAVSAMFVLLMSGLILYETSNIIHGGETNYIMATVTLYVSIFNLFTSLLHLLGFANRE